MTPIKFKGCNKTWGEGQDEYQPLPAADLEDEQGTHLFCWKLSPWERIKILFTGKLWHFVMTFRKPLQPQLLTVDSPLVSDKKEE